MLTKTDLLKLSKINNLKPWQQEKHYIQTTILLALSEYELVFKGGTYLWFFHGLNRFSEDLDFTALDKIDSSMCNKVEDFLSNFDLEPEIKNIIDNQRTFSFEVFTKSLLNSKEKSSVYIEISKRESHILKLQSYNIYFPYYDLPVKIIRGLDLIEVFAEKVRTIYNREKARDVYDLFILVKKGIKPNYKLINEKLKYFHLIYDKSSFFARLKDKKEIYNLELEGLVLWKYPEFDDVYQIICNVFDK